MDANLSPQLTGLLTQRLSGVRVEHVGDLGYANADDTQIISFSGM
ncbi:MAG: hypothetical protein ACRDJN_01165 [Chloroflexota bacterium]